MDGKTVIRADARGRLRQQIDVPDVSEPNATDAEKIIQNYKKLVTLSTCTSRDDMRFVVLGTLVGEYDRINKQLIYDSINK